MTLETRKIVFVQEFLNIQSEEIISRFEKILIKEKKSTNIEIFKPIFHEELHKRIDQSELDFKENRFKTSAELLDKFE